jgi:2-oxo-4-hydroxy-4-carboxy-5-ureidoimidazoline decarboxylase
VAATLEQLNSGDDAFFVATLGGLFEHSPWVAERAAAERPFGDREALRAALCRAMRAATAAEQLALIRAHPDLAGRLAREGALTRESTHEQASAGLDRLGDAELARFQALNDRYRERFGFPFVICARLNDRASILAAMERRLAHDPKQEFDTALDEIEKIAALRLADAVVAA